MPKRVVFSKVLATFSCKKQLIFFRGKMLKFFNLRLFLLFVSQSVLKLKKKTWIYDFYTKKAWFFTAQYPYRLVFATNFKLTPLPVLDYLFIIILRFLIENMILIILFIILFWIPFTPGVSFWNTLITYFLCYRSHHLQRQGSLIFSNVSIHISISFEF